MFRMINKTFLVVFIILGFLGIKSNGQNLTIDSKLDTNMILIGDQVKFTLEVTQPKDFILDFPLLQDTITDKIEIVEKFPIDTIIDKNNLLIKQEMLITSFDSGLYLIPRLPFTFKSPNDGREDTIFSPSRYFGVNTIQIDDTTNAIADIKLPIPAPYTLREAFPIIGGVLLIVLIVLAVIYYLRLRAGKESIILKKLKPKEPAHLLAYKMLDSVKDKKLWQQGKVKEFHSEVTEIMRAYIENRFDIMALEMTTDELMKNIHTSGFFDNETKDMLKNTLTQADFVKFAKANPLPDENEKSLRNAYAFVDRTKPVVQLNTGETKDDKSGTEIKEIENKIN